jgi:hypothetical protein
MTARNFICPATNSACTDKRCTIEFCVSNEADDVAARKVASVAEDRRKTAKSRAIVNDLIKRFR